MAGHVCPLCRAEGGACGPHTGAEPVDAALYGPPSAPTAATDQALRDVQQVQTAARLARRMEAGMAMVKVDRGDGTVYKFNEEDAKRYMSANPGAKLVGARRRSAAAAESKMVEAAAVEDKGLARASAARGK